MIHFAYPNADPGEEQFLGCGRYVAASQPPEVSYTEVSHPITPSVDKIQEAMARLVREPHTNNVRVYEVRDTSKAYQGASLDFAYFLVQLHRAWRLRIGCEGTTTDIWCTGEIDLADDGPHLKTVEPHAFDVKLTAFLADDNHDKLFLIPLANLAPRQQDWCDERAVETLTLADFRRLIRRTPMEVFAHKRIVMVGWNELRMLVSILFEQPRQSRKWYVTRIIFGVILTLLVGGFLLVKSIIQPQDAAFGIIAPINDSVVGMTNAVQVTTPYHDMNYCIVVTPQTGGNWIEACRRGKSASGVWTGFANFGNVGAGEGEQFILRVLATKSMLVPGQLEDSAIPKDARFSAPITVTRSMN